MPTDRASLDQRLAVAKPDDTMRGLIFNAGFGVVRRLLGDPEARACDPAQTGSRVPFFSYPVADYVRFAWAAADLLEAQLGSTDAVFFELGAAATRDVFASMLGRTLLSLSTNDPKDYLAQVPAGYRGTVGYGECTVHWRGAKHAVVTYRRDFLVPPFHCGVLTAALQAIGQKDVVATGRAVGLLDHDVELTWR
jgi:uncharacterized protein (TIGR02265 family)